VTHPALLLLLLLLLSTPWLLVWLRVCTWATALHTPLPP
jgi:hypothetical protein